MSNAIVSDNQRMKGLMGLLERKRGTIAAVLPKHITPERVIKVALSAAMRTPLLLQCSEQSFVLAVMQASELGLEPGSALGHAYLVPYRNGKTGKYECQMIPGYRGLISLARRSGEIVSIEAHPVYLRDKFKVAYGLEPVLEHTPWMPEFDTEGNVVGHDNPGAMIAVYAVAKLKDGGTQVEVMTRAQVDAIRRRSKAGSSGPWVSDYEEMARKTVVRRLFKYLPVSIELATALEHDARASGDEPAAPDMDVIEATSTDDGTPPESNSARELKEKLRGDSAPPPEPQAEAASDTPKLASAEAQTIALEISEAEHPGVLAGIRSRIDALAKKKGNEADVVELRKQIERTEAEFKASEG